MHETLTRLQQIPIYRRLFGLLLFLGLLVGFRHLAIMGVTWVVVARSLSVLGGHLGRLLRRSERFGVLVCLLLFSLVLVGLGFLLFHLGTRYYTELLALRSGRPLTDLLTELQTQTADRLPGFIHLEDLKDKAPALFAPAMVYLRATGRMLLHVLLGVILAVLYVLDRQPVDQLLDDIKPDGVLGALRRYSSFLGEAVVITITLQVVVAIVNTVLTLPVLLLLRLPHLLGFALLLFFSSLIPVVGNLVSGGVLIAAAYVYKGPVAVVVFVVSTFVLHKIEAYVLNPRLASRHVNLPAFVLIVSLILFEHAFGLVGLFLSFPALYVALNIAGDLRKTTPAAPGAAHPAPEVPVPQKPSESTEPQRPGPQRAPKAQQSKGRNKR